MRMPGFGPVWPVERRSWRERLRIARKRPRTTQRSVAVPGGVIYAPRLSDDEMRLIKWRWLLFLDRPLNDWDPPVSPTPNPQEDAD